MISKIRRFVRSSIVEDAAWEPEEAATDVSPQQETNPVVASVAAVRQAWLDAVRASDAGRLAALATDDVVAVHDDGHRNRHLKDGNIVNH